MEWGSEGTGTAGLAGVAEDGPAAKAAPEMIPKVGEKPVPGRGLQGQRGGGARPPGAWWDLVQASALLRVRWEPLSGPLVAAHGPTPSSTSFAWEGSMAVPLREGRSVVALPEHTALA